MVIQLLSVLYPFIFNGCLFVWVFSVVLRKVSLKTKQVKSILTTGMKREEEEEMHMLLETTGTDNLDSRNRTIIRVGRNVTKVVNRCHSLANASKDGMLSIQPRSRGQRHEELTAVRIGTRIGLPMINNPHLSYHGKNTRSGETQSTRNFVLKGMSSLLEHTHLPYPQMDSV